MAKLSFVTISPINAPLIVCDNFAPSNTPPPPYHTRLPWPVLRKEKPNPRRSDLASLCGDHPWEPQR
ncbi:hypothetical protein CRG98_018067 [Punica granatum]|uniref:Uncharacterized protein n=1 Tax=Punica granatum TaxID=22663 RepID=A0A2I0JZ20_PUNGR|nr:hypothetical protein CRG98_018067 [Punica granatum]